MRQKHRQRVRESETEDIHRKIGRFRDEQTESYMKQQTNSAGGHCVYKMRDK